MQSLYFLLPLLIIYELGASTYLWERGRAHTAHRMMLDFMDLFGVTGRHLPALVVVAALIAMHIARRQNGAHADTWKPEPKLYLAMLLEAMVLSLPLFVLMGIVMEAAGLMERLFASIQMIMAVFRYCASLCNKVRRLRMMSSATSICAASVGL